MKGECRGGGEGKWGKGKVEGDGRGEMGKGKVKGDGEVNGDRGGEGRWER